jgi:hypothetical protein
VRGGIHHNEACVVLKKPGLLKGAAFSVGCASSQAAMSVSHAVMSAGHIAMSADHAAMRGFI